MPFWSTTVNMKRQSHTCNPIHVLNCLVAEFEDSVDEFILTDTDLMCLDAL
jgi:hypothetical protein